MPMICGRNCEKVTYGYFDKKRFTETLNFHSNKIEMLLKPRIGYQAEELNNILIPPSSIIKIFYGHN